MGILRPKPRYRLYTSPRTYLSLLGGPLSRTSEDCHRLEEEVARRFEAAAAVCMPQARVGIWFAIRSLIQPGQEVVLSPYTIADVVNMVICAGARPVFADIERETCNIDPAEVERLVGERTGAVMATHLHGLSCDMTRLAKTCAVRKVPLVEDAAQAFGTRWEGRRVGTIGDAGVFSFGMYKNVTALFGGMVVARDPALVARIRAEVESWPPFQVGKLLRKAMTALATDVSTAPVMFQALVYHVFRFGHLHGLRMINRFVETELDLSRKAEMPEAYKRRLTPLQARLVLARLDRVDRDTAARVEHAKAYHEGLSDLTELILPPMRTDGSHMYSYYPIQFADRTRILRFLMERRRDVGRQHLKNCADLPAFQEFARDCPRARATADAVVLLPTYPRYGIDEVRRTVKAVRAFFGR